MTKLWPDPDNRIHARADLVCIERSVISADGPAAAREALRRQVLAAARQTITHGIQLVGQASQAVARMAASGDKAVPCLPPPKACSSVLVQLRLLDGQIITQPMVCTAAACSFIKSLSGPQQTLIRVLVNEHHSFGTLWLSR